MQLFHCNDYIYFCMNFKSIMIACIKMLYRPLWALHFCLSITDVLILKFHVKNHAHCEPQ